jgi:REP element-mobilizing transposase RayT
VRIEYEGARYHVMSRGDRREDIVTDDGDRQEFLRALGEACQKTGWQVHAYCLMTNHFHLVVETPQPNLALGMKWLLGTYTQRFNRRHRSWGHVFGGRYKAQVIDSRSPGYLRRACAYVHLNPVRAGLVRPGERLESFPWSSYPAYRNPRLRPCWLRVDRLLGENGLQKDTARARRAFERLMTQAQLDAAGLEGDVFRRGWKVGAQDFSDWLKDQLTRKSQRKKVRAERSKSDADLAEEMVQKALEKVRWREIDLALTPKSHSVKAKIAVQLRTNTPMTRQWIANRLKIGSSSYLAALLANEK